MRYYIKSKLFKIKEDFWVKNNKPIDKWNAIIIFYKL